MNIYHWIIIALYAFSFLLSLHRNGQPLKSKNYNAAESFYICALMVVLVFLSAYCK